MKSAIWIIGGVIFAAVVFPSDRCPAAEETAVKSAEESKLIQLVPDMKKSDVFTIARAIKECLYPAGFYRQTGYYEVGKDQTVDEAYYKEKILVFDELLCRSCYGFTRACYDGHDAALCLLYSGKSDEARKLEDAAKKHETDYYALLQECRNLAKLDKKEPQQAPAKQKDLIERLKQTIKAHENFGQEAIKIVSAHRKEPVKSPRKEFEKYYFSSQVGLDGAFLNQYKIKVADDARQAWYAGFNWIFAAMGMEAVRGSCSIYMGGSRAARKKKDKSIGIKVLYEDGFGNLRDWTHGVTIDGIALKDKLCDAKTGAITDDPKYPVGSYFYSDDMAVRDQEHVYKTAMALKDQEWFYAYNQGNEIHLAGYNSGFTGYGEVPRQFFVKWLREKYKTIDGVNSAWGTSYKDFPEISLPYKWPQTPAEHAVHEDWCAFREYIIARHHILFYEAVKAADKTHPVVNRTLWHSGGFHKNIVFCGYDQYELSKGCDFDGGHIVGGNYPSDVENQHGYYFLHFNSTGKRMYESEWTPFHQTQFPHTVVNFGTRRRLYTDAFQGGVGWQVFCLGDHMREIGIGHYGPYFGYVRIDGYPNLIGWELKEFIDRSKYYEHLLAGGKELRDDVALLWSQTNYHHDADKWKETKDIGIALNTLNQLQYARKVLFEQEILAGKLKEGRYPVVIMPWIEYINREVCEKLLEYVKQGGTLIATGYAGRWSGYGRDNNLIASASGVKAVPAGASDSRAVKYELISADKAETVSKASDGSIVSVEVPYGKGKMIMTGKADGPLYELALKRTKARRVCETDNRNILARLWEYSGKKYLALVNLNMKEWQHIKIKMEGREKLKDLYLGMRLAADGQTQMWMTALMPGEGRIYELE